MRTLNSRTVLCSLLLWCGNKGDFQLASHSLTALSSRSIPEVFPFEADLIPHICTSIFLKSADRDCFDPFHKRVVRPKQPATLKSEVISSNSLLQILSWLTWELLYVIYIGQQGFFSKLCEEEHSRVFKET